MNGYIIVMLDRIGDLSGDGIRASWDEGSEVVRKRIGGKCVIAGWGRFPGDVYLASDDDNSGLILSGYVTGLNGANRYESQEEVASALRERLDVIDDIGGACKLAGELNGSFSIVHARASDGRIICISDRKASRPIWTKRGAGKWTVSSHALAIAETEGGVEFDYAGLGSFFLYGGQMDHTMCLFKEIRSVAEATARILRENGRVEDTKWRAARHSPLTTRNRSEWADTIAEAAKQSARRILSVSKSPMIFLSGGVDSRLTAAAFRAVGARPFLVTLCDSENIETRVARKVAEALGCKHQVIARDPFWYLRAMLGACFESNGCYVWTHAHFSEAFQLCAEKHDVSCALLGDCCEAFSKLMCSVEKGRAKPWTVEEFLKGFDSLPLPVYRPRVRGQTLRLFRADIRDEIEEEVKRSIRRRYEEILEVSDDPRILGDFFLAWQSATCMPTYMMQLDLRSVARERALMFDNDILDILEVLPSVMRDRANLGAMVIKRLWPKAARISDSNTLVPLCWPSNLHWLARVTRPYLGKLRRRFIENSYRTTGSWPHKALLYGSNETWRSFIEGTLSRKDLFDSRVFDHAAIDKCWTAFREGDLARSQDVEKLIQIGQIQGRLRSRMLAR